MRLKIAGTVLTVLFLCSFIDVETGINNLPEFSLVQFRHPVVSNSTTPLTAAHQASLSNTNSWSLLKLMSIESVMPTHPLLSPSPPSLSLSQHQGLCQWVSSSHQWPKYWSFSFSISPSNEYSGLISFRIDWLDLLTVQGTLKIFSNTTVQEHQFFSPQLSLWSNSHIHILLLEKP